MQNQLKTAIKRSGGADNTLEYADALLIKINQIQSVAEYAPLVGPLLAAGQEGDFRGRVLEVNFASAFLDQGIALKYGARQGQPGDIDFRWDLNGRQVFIEMKLLGQDQRTREMMSEQIDAYDAYFVQIPDDLRDVSRIQRDIFLKSSTKKFHPIPCQDWLNLVAIDVAELQLGSVDLADCVLAVLGNAGVVRYFEVPCHRPSVVGVLESVDASPLAADQVQWVADYHQFGYDTHPRNYIHGVVFLFREPRETAALSYQLRAAIVWNPALVDAQLGTQVCTAFHQIIPFQR